MCFKFVQVCMRFIGACLYTWIVCAYMMGCWLFTGSSPVGSDAPQLSKASVEWVRTCAGLWNRAKTGCQKLSRGAAASCREWLGNARCWSCCLRFASENCDRLDTLLRGAMHRRRHNVNVTVKSVGAALEVGDMSRSLFYMTWPQP